MSLLLNSFTVLLLLLLLISPILIARSRVTFAKGSTISVVTAAVFCCLAAWWNAAALDLQLWWMGVDLTTGTYGQATAHLTPDDKQRADILFTQRVSGVGWPVHVMVGCVFALPYAGLIFVAVWFRRQKKQGGFTRSGTP